MGERHAVCHHPSRTKKNVTHKKKKIFGLTAAELEGKKHTTTRGGGAFLKTRLFAESLLMFLNVYLVVVSFYGFTNDLTHTKFQTKPIHISIGHVYH